MSVVRTRGTLGRRYGMTGDVAAAYVDAADVAAAAAGALATTAQAGPVYEITGPEAMTCP